MDYFSLWVIVDGAVANVCVHNVASCCNREKARNMVAPLSSGSTQHGRKGGM